MSFEFVCLKFNLFMALPLCSENKPSVYEDIFNQAVENIFVWLLTFFWIITRGVSDLLHHIHSNTIWRSRVRSGNCEAYAQRFKDDFILYHVCSAKGLSVYTVHEFNWPQYYFSSAQMVLNLFTCNFFKQYIDLSDGWPDFTHHEPPPGFVSMDTP